MATTTCFSHTPKALRPADRVDLDDANLQAKNPQRRNSVESLVFDENYNEHGTAVASEMAKATDKPTSSHITAPATPTFQRTRKPLKSVQIDENSQDSVFHECFPLASSSTGPIVGLLAHGPVARQAAPATERVKATQSLNRFSANNCHRHSDACANAFVGVAVELLRLREVPVTERLGTMFRVDNGYYVSGALVVIPLPAPDATATRGLIDYTAQRSGQHSSAREPVSTASQPELRCRLTHQPSNAQQGAVRTEKGSADGVVDARGVPLRMVAVWMLSSASFPEPVPVDLQLMSDSELQGVDAVDRLVGLAVRGLARAGVAGDRLATVVTPSVHANPVLGRVVDCLRLRTRPDLVHVVGAVEVVERMCRVMWQEVPDWGVVLTALDAMLRMRVKQRIPREDRVDARGSRPRTTGRTLAQHLEQQYRRHPQRILRCRSSADEGESSDATHGGAGPSPRVMEEGLAELLTGWDVYQQYAGEYQQRAVQQDDAVQGAADLLAEFFGSVSMRIFLSVLHAQLQQLSALHVGLRRLANQQAGGTLHSLIGLEERLGHTIGFPVEAVEEGLQQVLKQYSRHISHYGTPPARASAGAAAAWLEGMLRERLGSYPPSSIPRSFLQSASTISHQRSPPLYQSFPMSPTTGPQSAAEQSETDHNRDATADRNARRETVTARSAAAQHPLNAANTAKDSNNQPGCLQSPLRSCPGRGSRAFWSQADDAGPCTAIERDTVSDLAQDMSIGRTTLTSTSQKTCQDAAVLADASQPPSCKRSPCKLRRSRSSSHSRHRHRRRRRSQGHATPQHQHQHQHQLQHQYQHQHQHQHQHPSHLPDWLTLRAPLCRALRIMLIKAQDVLQEEGGPALALIRTRAQLELPMQQISGRTGAGGGMGAWAPDPALVRCLRSDMRTSRQELVGGLTQLVDQGLYGWLHRSQQSARMGDVAAVMMGITAPEIETRSRDWIRVSRTYRGDRGTAALGEGAGLWLATAVSGVCVGLGSMYKVLRACDTRTLLQATVAAERMVQSGGHRHAKALAAQRPALEEGVSAHEIAKRREEVDSIWSDFTSHVLTEAWCGVEAAYG